MLLHHRLPQDNKERGPGQRKTIIIFRTETFRDFIPTVTVDRNE